MNYFGKIVEKSIHNQKNYSAEPGIHSNILLAVSKAAFTTSDEGAYKDSVNHENSHAIKK